MLPISEVTDEDISWVSELMQLENIVGSRRDFLMSLSSVDVMACPGSGKTTLLVAKLGLLAKKWKTATAGICVLSHTNVAKDEISDRLGGSEVGTSILRYPNYIDTIHGFTNRFLTTPFLNSVGFRAATIDDEATEKMRRLALPQNDARTLENWLQRTNRSIGTLRISSLDLENPLLGQNFRASSASRMYKLATKALSAAAKAGFFCHDEILTLGHLFAKTNPYVVRALRKRFPIVLVDEMQDNSQKQNQIIQEVFTFGDGNSIVQRVGDLNQAIYGGSEAFAGLEFPDTGVRLLSLDDSYRFDDSIANLANGFAVSKVLPEGLRGVAKPKRRINQGVHKIFVFPDGDPTGVLPAFGNHVMSVLPPEIISGAKVCAVGGVSRPYPDIGPGHDHFPKSVAHYWDGYNSNATKKSYRPQRLAEYFTLASATLATSSSSHEAVNIIANGLSRLVNIMAQQHRVATNRRQHLHLTQLLRAQPEALRQYQSILAYVLAGGKFDSQEAWDPWVPSFMEVPKGFGIDPTIQAAGSYLSWQATDPNIAKGSLLPKAGEGLNIYRYVDENSNNTLDIQLGSIHSVKGETHTATLLLETFYYEHHIAHLMSWLTRQEESRTPLAMPESTANFMRWAYVALSRPTHVACIAVPERSFETANDANQLDAAGWKIERI